MQRLYNFTSSSSNITIGFIWNNSQISKYLNNIKFNKIEFPSVWRWCIPLKIRLRSACFISSNDLENKRRERKKVPFAGERGGAVAINRYSPRNEFRHFNGLRLLFENNQRSTKCSFNYPWRRFTFGFLKRRPQRSCSPQRAKGQLWEKPANERASNDFARPDSFADNFF